LISILIACATAPINIVVDFLFQDIFAAPSAEEYTVQLESRQVHQGVSDQLSQAVTAARGVIGGAISLHDQKRTRRPSLSVRVKENFAVPDAETRRIPLSVIDAHDSTSMLLKDVFDSKKVDQSERFSFHNSSRGEEEVCVFDSAERGEVGAEDTTSFDSFTSRLLAQSEQLQGEAKIEFEERWGFGTDFYMSDIERAITSRERRGSMGVIERQARDDARKDVLSRAIEITTITSNEVIAKLKIVADVHVGLEIMHVFIMDLLG
jgi:hypothetical protein